MITIVSINKSSEGLILKSTIRYSWAFKIGKNSHLVEFLEGSMGKKSLQIDSVEKSSKRTIFGKFSDKFLLENILFELKADDEDYDIFLLEENVKFKDLFKNSKKKIDERNSDNKNGNFSQNKFGQNNMKGFGNNIGNGKNEFGNNYGNPKGFGSEWDFSNSINTNNMDNKKLGNKNFDNKNSGENIDFLDLGNEPEKKNGNNLNNFQNFNFGKKNDVDNFAKKNNFHKNTNNNKFEDDFENSKNKKTGFEEDFENFENNPFSEKPKTQKILDPWGNSENDFSKFDFDEQKLKAQKKYKIFDKNQKQEIKKKEIAEDIFEDENDFEKATLVHNENKKEFKMTLDSEKEEKIEDAFYTEADFDNEFENKEKNKSKFKFNYDIDPEESYKNMKKGFKNLFKKTSKLVDKFENKCKNMVYGNTDEKDIEDHVQYEDKKEVHNLGNEIQSFYGGNDIEESVDVRFKVQSKGNPFEENDQLKGLRTETPFLDEFVGEENLNTPDFGGFDKKNVFGESKKNGFGNKKNLKNGFGNDNFKDEFKKGFENGFEKNNSRKNGLANEFDDVNKKEYFSEKNNFQNRKKIGFGNFNNQNKNEDNYLEKVLSSGFLNINEFENTNTTSSTPFD